MPNDPQRRPEGAAESQPMYGMPPDSAINTFPPLPDGRHPLTMRALAEAMQVS